MTPVWTNYKLFTQLIPCLSKSLKDSQCVVQIPSLSRESRLTKKNQYDSKPLRQKFPRQGHVT